LDLLFFSMIRTCRNPIRRRNYLGCPDAVLLKARVGFPVDDVKPGSG
jgi:hypothetical protein